MIATDDLLGIPFELGGRNVSHDGATDCLGISMFVVRERCGIPAEDPWPQLQPWDEDETVHGRVPDGWQEVTREDLVAGDVGVLNRGRQCAAYLGDGWWITSIPLVGVTRFAWQHRPEFEAFYRWVG